MPSPMGAGLFLKASTLLDGVADCMSVAASCEAYVRPAAGEAAGVAAEAMSVDNGGGGESASREWPRSEDRESGRAQQDSVAHLLLVFLLGGRRVDVGILRSTCEPGQFKVRHVEVHGGAVGYEAVVGCETAAAAARRRRRRSCAKVEVELQM